MQMKNDDKSLYADLYESTLAELGKYEEWFEAQLLANGHDGDIDQPLSPSTYNAAEYGFYIIGLLAKVDPEELKSVIFKTIQDQATSLTEHPLHDISLGLPLRRILDNAERFALYRAPEYAVHLKIRAVCWFDKLHEVSRAGLDDIKAACADDTIFNLLTIAAGEGATFYRVYDEFDKFNGEPEFIMYDPTFSNKPVFIRKLYLGLSGLEVKD